MPYKKSLLIVGMLIAVFFMILAPMDAQDASAPQSAIDGQSLAQATKSPLNPAWLAYEQDRMTGKAITRTSTTGESFGLIPSTVDLSHIKGKEPSAAALTYNPSYDLRTVGKVSSVKNQNPYGTCWAFASIASLESYLMPTENPNFSEYDMVMNSQFTRADPMDDGGSYTMSTAYLARWSGPVNEADAPYPGGDVHSANSTIQNTLTTQKHTQEVYFLPRASATDNNNIKWALTTKGAVGIGLSWDGAYYGNSPATYYNPTTSGVGHAVTIVGWDDNYPSSNFHGATAPPGNGAFIVKNSWGTAWGDSGYFWLSYYDASIQDLIAAFTAEPASNYAAIYQYDPLGWVSNYGYYSTTCWAANVFTADSSARPLCAVSFYTNDVNTQYEVYIYTNPTSGPIGGTKHIGPTGTMQFPGYHTVKLTSPIPLSAGQKFSVVVKFKNPAYVYPVAFEYAVTGYSEGANALSGQSYTSPDGASWNDMHGFDPSSNVCIKAFTCPITPTLTPSGIGLFRPSTARWYLDYDKNGASNYQVTWGASTDKPVAGDWDGDGMDEIGLFRPSTARWYLDYDNNGASDYQVTWGASTDIPVAGDWDGDGKDEIGLFRPSTARWYLDYDNNGASNYQVTWGASTDKPVAGDWDGDGKDEIGLFRPSTARWYLDYDNNGASNYQVTWGASSDIPVAEDWDGDGKDEIGLFRPSTRMWYLDYDNNGASDYRVTWGDSTDKPVVGRWTECMPGVCGSITQCDSSCGSLGGYCFKTTEGTGKCLENWYCSDTYTSCTSSSQCGGGACVTGSCCGHNECRPASTFCGVNKAPAPAEQPTGPTASGA